MSYKMNFWRFFATYTPCCIGLASLYCGEVFHLEVSAADCWMRDVQMVLMTSVSSVGGMPCSFARLIYTPQECPLSQPPRLIAARIRLMTCRVQMSRSLPQPLQLDILRKTAKTVHLKLSKYLDKNIYNYVEQLIGFRLNVELVYKKV